MGAKSFHMTVSLVGGLQLPDRELRGMLVSQGRELTPDEARQVMIDALRKGYDVLPMCDHHDEKGHCLGHDEPEGGDDAR